MGGYYSLLWQGRDLSISYLCQDHQVGEFVGNKGIIIPHLLRGSVYAHSLQCWEEFPCSLYEARTSYSCLLKADYIQ